MPDNVIAFPTPSERRQPKRRLVKPSGAAVVAIKLGTPVCMIFKGNASGIVPVEHVFPKYNDEPPAA